ncbi:MAG: hypothetical protein HFH85_16010 [Lachnospiraceae bacterium]|jgi:hypothetical protein|nr:hypothetical protein [Lachnospiraceae bacterium]
MIWNLNGDWKCELPGGKIIDIQVPGCWDRYVEEKDIADRVRLVKTFQIPDLPKEHFRLFFGGVSYYCRVFLNGAELGVHEGMWDGFSMDADGAAAEGENRLTVDVWKPGYHEGDRFPLRQVLSGFIPDVLCTFGGIWDAVRLESARHFFVEGHYAQGDERGDGKLTLRLIHTKSKRPVQVTGRILDPYGAPAAEICHICVQEETEIGFHVETPLLWSPGTPCLYRYDLLLSDGETQLELENTFGFRTIRGEKSRVLMNGTPIYPRGILHWGCYEEITPAPGADVIRDEIRKVQRYGFNMIKHCLYIPREAYFRLADESGMLLWVELPLWLPEESPWLEERIRREFPRLIRQIAGHPCVAFLSLGCELDDKVGEALLEEMYGLAREILGIPVRDNSGSGECYGGLAVDHADFSDYHFYGDIQNMEPILEAFTPVWKQDRPWLFGEFCDSDTLRDLREVRERSRVKHFFWELQDEARNPICRLKPDFFLGKHDVMMEKSGIRKEFPLLKALSYDHAMVHRKVTLEQTRSFPIIGGYNITSLRDVTIAASGLFDDFMEEKFDPEILGRFNGDVVLLPAWDLTRIWINADRIMPRERYGFFGGEIYGLHVLLSNYGGCRLAGGVVRWELQGTCGEILHKGRKEGRDVDNGTVGELCYLTFPLPRVREPKTCILQAAFACGDTQTVNSWPIFLYPCPEKSDIDLGLYDPLHVFRTVEKYYPRVEETDGREGLNRYEILFCSLLTPEIFTYIKAGGKAVYVQRQEGALPVHFVAFWREGMIRQCDHPMLEGLLRESWMDDLRYFGSSTDTAFADEEDDRFDYRRPILRRYDCREWRADDYLCELGCGKGTIIATTLRLEGGMGKEPLFLENNRFGRWLLDRAVHYLLENC